MELDHYLVGRPAVAGFIQSILRNMQQKNMHSFEPPRTEIGICGIKERPHYDLLWMHAARKQETQHW